MVLKIGQQKKDNINKRIQMRNKGKDKENKSKSLEQAKEIKMKK